jgi:hypothetical protein
VWDLFFFYGIDAVCNTSGCITSDGYGVPFAGVIGAGVARASTPKWIYSVLFWTGATQETPAAARTAEVLAAVAALPQVR